MTVSHAEIKAYVDRILRLKEEQDGIGQDIKDIYAEAKGNGFDKTALGDLVTHLRKIEKKGAASMQEREALFDLYLSSYHTSSHAHAREGGRTEAIQ